MEWSLVIARLQDEASERYKDVKEGKYDLDTARGQLIVADVCFTLAQALLAGCK
jgi:hypothetical protein